VEARAGSGAASDEVTSQRIAGELRTAILAGGYPPGTWLRQDELATRFGASRLPVREALRILHSEGLAETFPHRGTRVPLLDLAEIDILYRMRERLEPLTLSESIARINDEQVLRLEHLQDEIEANTDIGRFLALDRDFHMTSYAACPSEQLLAITTRLWNATQHYRRAFMMLVGTQDRRAVVDAEHRLIVDAVRRRDPEDGERFLSGHIRRTRVALTGHPELFHQDG